MCSTCGAKYLTPGSCPNGHTSKAVVKSNDEFTKKVVDDDDLFKGGF